MDRSGAPQSPACPRVPHALLLQSARRGRAGESGFRNRAFYRFAASVHYEVGHANPNHADVEVCPICGRTGEYAGVAGNLVERVHDPLGLELLLCGTILTDYVATWCDTVSSSGYHAGVYC